MKKPILTLIVVCGLFFGGCKKTLEEKAHRLIHKYINENVDDISSYEEISTSPIDSLFTNYGLQPEITEYLREAKKQSDEIKILTALSEAVKPFAYFHRPSAIELGDYGRKIKQHAEILGAYNDSIQIFKQNFTPVFVGLTANHKYRSKDKDGATTIKEITFVFNDDCTEISPYSIEMEQQ